MNNTKKDIVLISQEIYLGSSVILATKNKSSDDTYSTVQSPSWVANWFAASQEIPRISRNPQGSLPHSQPSATCLYPGPAQSSPYTHITPPEDPS